MAHAVIARGTQPRDLVESLNAHAIRLAWPMRCDTGGVYKAEGLQLLHDTWTDKAKGDIPFRRDFTMTALKSVIANIAIIERQLGAGSPLYRVRLAGLNITEIFGDMNGQLLDERLLGTFASRWQRCIDVALEAARSYRIVGNFEMLRANYLGGEIFLAPMRKATGEITKVLTGFSFHERHAGEILARG